MTKMTKGTINRLRMCSILFHGEPGRWQTCDGRYEVIRSIRLVDDPPDPPVEIVDWGIYDNAQGDWVPGTTAIEYETMREAVHHLKTLLEEEV